MASTPWPERSSESTPGPRVAGIDPGTLVDALVAHRPLDIVLGPAGYGLPLVPGERVGERELGLMLLLRRDQAGADAGIGGMRAMIRALIGAEQPLVFGPGAIHLPTVPEYRKWNRIDLGTADKVCSAALCIVDQADRLGLAYEETSFIMLELGGAFSAALAIDRGQIVDGLGGSCMPIGARACGALDALADRLAGVAGVRAAAGLGTRAKAAAQGAALLADGLAGGRYAPLVRRLRLSDAGGTVVDHLRM